jgi:hypothetical protein
MRKYLLELLMQKTTQNKPKETSRRRAIALEREEQLLIWQDLRAQSGRQNYSLIPIGYAGAGVGEK